MKKPYMSVGAVKRRSTRRKKRRSSVGAFSGQGKMDTVSTLITGAELGVGVAAAEYASELVKQNVNIEIVKANPKIAAVAVKTLGALATGYAASQMKNNQKDAYTVAAGMLASAALEAVGSTVTLPAAVKNILPGISGMSQLGQGTVYAIPNARQGVRSAAAGAGSRIIRK